MYREGSGEIPRSFSEVGYNIPMYYVYILNSDKDNSKYIGVTTDLKNRLQEHNASESKYSKSKAPFKLSWYCSFVHKAKAYEFERYLKSSSGFAFRNKHLI